MALHWQPVGPEPAQTYWMRRAAVALAVLVPLLLLISLLTGGEDDDQLTPPPSTSTPSAGPTPSPTPLLSADPSASPSASASPTVAAAACTDEALQIEAAATDDSYAVGAAPKLELRVTNTGTAPCSRDLGQAAVELLVVSGSDRIWSSDDCAPGGAADVTTLEPGEPEVSSVTWSGSRSEPGCDGEQDRAAAGTYRVSGRVGALREEGEPFVLR